MKFKEVAGKKPKMVLTVCEDVSGTGPGYKWDPGVEVRTVALRGLSADEALPLLTAIRESALRVRHEIPSRDENALINAVRAHMVLLNGNDVVAKDFRLIDSLTQTIREVHTRFLQINPLVAGTFLTTTLASYGGTELHSYYDRQARDAVRETIAGLRAGYSAEEQEPGPRALPEILLA